MTRDELVDDLIAHAKRTWRTYWRSLPDEQRLRLGGLEEELRSITAGVQAGLWAIAAEYLDELAIEQEGDCRCGRRRERRKGSVEVDILGHRVRFCCTYLYCRSCHDGSSPTRRWLGKEHGGVSLAFERALTDLTTRMTFGDAATSMKEHHGQKVDRTKAERVTYNAARAGQEYLRQRRHQARQKLRSGDHEGVEQLLFTADGGAIPVGKLERPPASQVRVNTPRSEVRQLPKGTRKIVGREARYISVHGAEPEAERVVDCHIAPYEETRYTGERMLTAAIEAGLGDKSHIHGVFDMGKWIHSQYEGQFGVYAHSACADIMHVAEYLIDAGRVIAGPEEAVRWGMERKRRMLAGEYERILGELREHECGPQCLRSDGGKCLVRVAQTYLENNGRYMLDYADFMVRNLPVGSGEAESGIRHVIKRRMAVAGAWEENNAPLMLALLAIRASGWWDDFWRWRDEQDRRAWHERREGKVKVLFRGKRQRRTPRAA